MDTKRCAKCGSEYDAAYDGCPRCADRSGWSKAIAAVVAVLVILTLCACCIQPSLYTAFMQGLTG